MLLWLVSAWLMGLVGSTHCIGMCGPLALSLPIGSQSVLGRLFESLVYNLGRVFTYGIYGALLGVGSGLLVPSFLQNQLSLLMGGLMLLLAIYAFGSGRVQFDAGPQSAVFRRISSTLGILYRRGGTPGLFGIGVLNGLLPCGLVYLALATAFASASVMKSTLFMVFFGLGTLPAMWSVLFLSRYLTPTFRGKLRRFIPYVYAATGVLLLLRGLGNHNPLQALMPALYCSK